jgi:phosphate-selective porin OprO/OprP
MPGDSMGLYIAAHAGSSSCIIAAEVPYGRTWRLAVMNAARSTRRSAMLNHGVISVWCGVLMMTIVPVARAQSPSDRAPRLGFPQCLDAREVRPDREIQRLPAVSQAMPSTTVGESFGADRGAHHPANGHRDIPATLASHWVPDPAASAAGLRQGDSDDLAERLQELEDEWKKFREGEAKKKADALKKPTMKINGRIHLDHWAFPEASDGIGFFEHPANGTDPEDRFAFRRLRMSLAGDILYTMLYKLEVDFNNPGTPEYKDMYLGFQELPYNQVVLIGNQKRPLGLDHLNSSRFNVFMERPLVIEAFNEDARRMGIAGYGYTEDELYHWRYGVYNLENTSTTGRYIGDSLQLSGNARLSSSPWYDEASEGRGYFHWAIAGMVARPDGDRGPFDSNNNEARFRTRTETRSDTRWLDTAAIPLAEWYEIGGLEAILNVGPLQIVSEYQCNWLQREVGPELFFHGAYIYFAYMLTGEFVPYDRQTGCIDRLVPYENFFLVERCHGGTGWGLGAWQVALRLSYLDLTDQDIAGGVGRDVTLGLNWYWTPYSKLQFNAVYGDIEQHRPVGGFTDGHFLSLGTRFVCDF